MESTRMKCVLIVAAVLGFLGTFTLKAEAQMSGCSNSIMSLSPCLSFITSNFTNPSPSQSCCSALASVVKTSVSCLCPLFTATSANNPLGFPINQTRALTLPGACKITTTPLSQCNGSVTAGAGPAASPASAPSAIPGAPSNDGAAASATPKSAPSAQSPKSSVNIPTEVSPVGSPGAVEGPTPVNSSANLGLDATSIGSTALVCFASFILAFSGFSMGYQFH